ncbi:hypothetical protein H0H87_008606 [Tephrocybe sp. NHM501043]|nr:hypothetical protein H0H87_008606 [Tephrocybe sp. NHM501043]
MKKTVTPFTAQLVTYETSLPFDVVISRLDQNVNKTGSAGFVAKFAAATTREEIAAIVDSITGGKDFLYFMQFTHDRWMNIINGPNIYPPAVVYTIGNPIIAGSFMRYDMRTGLDIPPRVMVLGNAANNGTTVFYHRPSSLVTSPNVEVLQALWVLDEKLDLMITNITLEG